jgi:hypothetical protein
MAVTDYPVGQVPEFIAQDRGRYAGLRDPETPRGQGGILSAEQAKQHPPLCDVVSKTNVVLEQVIEELSDLTGKNTVTEALSKDQVGGLTGGILRASEYATRLHELARYLHERIGTL